MFDAKLFESLDTMMKASSRLSNGVYDVLAQTEVAVAKTNLSSAQSVGKLQIDMYEGMVPSAEVKQIKANNRLAEAEVEALEILNRKGKAIMERVKFLEDLAAKGYEEDEDGNPVKIKTPKTK